MKRLLTLCSLLLSALCPMLYAQNLGPVYEKASGGISVTGIDAASLGDGSVSTTEFQYINTLSSNAQTQITGKATLAGASGGQTLIGGTGTTDDLILQSTSGVGATGAEMQFKVGNNGATRAMTILNNGLVGIGTSAHSNLSGAYFGGTQVNPLWVSSPTGLTGLVVQGTDGQAIQFINNTSNTATADFGYYAPDIWFVNRTNSGNITFSEKTSGGSTVYPLMLYPSGKASMHSQSTDAALEVNLGTAEKFRLSYNDANGSAAVYVDQTLGSTGIVTLNAVGSGQSFVFDDPIKPKGYTVATLPTGVVGMHAYVTDATAPTYLGALTGGGAVTCPVFYNGTAWVSH